jgi:hypothetical protein
VSSVKRATASVEGWRALVSAGVRGYELEGEMKMQVQLRVKTERSEGVGMERGRGQKGRRDSLADSPS